MRADAMPALALILALIAAPLQAETASEAPAESTAQVIIEPTGPKFIQPEISSAPMRLDDPALVAATLAEEILSAATLDENISSAVSEEPVPATPAHSPEVVLAVATSGVNRAITVVEELTRETIEVRVSIAQQMMEVYYKGEMIHEWPVSTARKGKVTPKGSFKPQWLSKNHKSSLYNNAPMPYSIFYSGNYAIHGTDQESKLGRPASAGCVRLSRANAKILFAMVQQEGKSRMKVEILD